MPRIARIIAPGYPHHVTQRGNNRTTVFFDDQDRQTYLKLLSKYSESFSLQVWAYCLMDNHVHLLVVPERGDSLARGIGLTNQVYTQYLNRKLKKSGRIWQNRFFSCLIDHQEYLWAVARYIEQNPVKAGLVIKAEDYCWSSAKAHLLAAVDEILWSPSWLDGSERGNYSDFLSGVDGDVEIQLRKATQAGLPFGSDGFIDAMESRFCTMLRSRKPGRPCK
jgi:putative transposase